MTKAKDSLISVEYEARLAAAETRITALADELARYKKSTADYEEIIRRYLKLHDREVAYIFERLQCLEFKSYPELASDICRIDEVIGESDLRADHPLDRRSTTKR